jgi:hypothetical protein
MKQKNQTALDRIIGIIQQENRNLEEFCFETYAESTPFYKAFALVVGRPLQRLIDQFPEPDRRIAEAAPIRDRGPPEVSTKTTLSHAPIANVLGDRFERPSFLTGSERDRYERPIADLRRDRHDRKTSRLNLSSFNESQVRAWDDGEMHDVFQYDERNVAVFTGLHYSLERQTWLARMESVSTRLGPVSYDLTQAELLEWGKKVKSTGGKPSQSLLALHAFEQRIDREAARLTFDF